MDFVSKGVSSHLYGYYKTFMRTQASKVLDSVRHQNMISIRNEFYYRYYLYLFFQKIFFFAFLSPCVGTPFVPQTHIPLFVILIIVVAAFLSNGTIFSFASPGIPFHVAAVMPAALAS